jgi:hypothetical protein
MQGAATCWRPSVSSWHGGSCAGPGFRGGDDLFDAKAHFQAQVQFLANAIHTGQSPFWNHNVFAGSPQIADPNR